MTDTSTGDTSPKGNRISRAFSRAVDAVNDNVSPGAAIAAGGIGIVLSTSAGVIFAVPPVAHGVGVALSVYVFLRGNVCHALDWSVLDKLPRSLESIAIGFSVALGPLFGIASASVQNIAPDAAERKTYLETLPALPAENDEVRVPKPDLERLACTGKTGPIIVTLSGKDHKLNCPAP